mmetsp:Transcript_66987/g.159828  ORF Transcript_66987/g.159828 Transcript_66987/m.159828 type:complete len:208 (+) Transcript_66987:696-1319(+)
MLSLFLAHLWHLFHEIVHGYNLLTFLQLHEDGLLVLKLRCSFHLNLHFLLCLFFQIRHEGVFGFTEADAIAFAGVIPAPEEVGDVVPHRIAELCTPFRLTINIHDDCNEHVQENQEHAEHEGDVENTGNGSTDLIFHSDEICIPHQRPEERDEADSKVRIAFDCSSKETHRHENVRDKHRKEDDAEVNQVCKRHPQSSGNHCQPRLE